MPAMVVTPSVGESDMSDKLATIRRRGDKDADASDQMLTREEFWALMSEADREALRLLRQCDAAFVCAERRPNSKIAGIADTHDGDDNEI